MRRFGKQGRIASSSPSRQGQAPADTHLDKLTYLGVGLFAGLSASLVGGDGVAGRKRLWPGPPSPSAPGR